MREKRRFLLIVAVACFALVRLSTAWAQTLTSNDLEKMIRDNYPYGGASGITLPDGWCFHTIVDRPSYHYWHLKATRDKPNSGLQPTVDDNNNPQPYGVLIERSTGVQTIYGIGTANPNYSFIMIGLEMEGDGGGPYRSLFASSLSLPSLKLRTTGACISLAQYIELFLHPYQLIMLQNETPDFDPDTTVNKKKYRWWYLDGRYRNATNIWRLKINLRISPGDPFEAYLIIGYGGASGP